MSAFSSSRCLAIAILWLCSPGCDSRVPRAAASAASEPRASAEVEDEAFDTDALIERVRRSGPPSEDAWTDRARTLFARWHSAAPDDVRALATLETPACFQSGCISGMYFASAEIVDLATQDFYASTAHATIAAMVFRSAPTARASYHDQSAVVWIVLRLNSEER